MFVFLIYFQVLWLKQNFVMEFICFFPKVVLWCMDVHCVSTSEDNSVVLASPFTFMWLELRHVWSTFSCGAISATQDCIEWLYAMCFRKERKSTWLGKVMENFRSEIPSRGKRRARSHSVMSIWMWKYTHTHTGLQFYCFKQL